MIIYITEGIKMFHGFKILFILAFVSCGIDQHRSLRYYPDTVAETNQILDNQQQKPYQKKNGRNSKTQNQHGGKTKQEKTQKNHKQKRWK